MGSICSFLDEGLSCFGMREKKSIANASIFCSFGGEKIESYDLYILSIVGDQIICWEEGEKRGRNG
jgi:hypothetical protein